MVNIKESKNMKYLKKFNEAKTKKEYDSSIETVTKFVSVPIAFSF